MLLVLVPELWLQMGALHLQLFRSLLCQKQQYQRQLPVTK
jgi:hypothetical protein